MHAPCTGHMIARKCILCYVQGTLHYGLHLYPSHIEKLISHTHVDWGGCSDIGRSTSDYCVFLGDNLISWSSKRQPTLSRPVQKLSTRMLLMMFVNLVGFTIFTWSFTTHFPRLRWCTAIMLVSSTFPVIQCSISVLNILWWAFTLSGKRSCVARHTCFMFLLVTWLLTYSPKADLEFFLMISKPI